MAAPAPALSWPGSQKGRGGQSMAGSQGSGGKARIASTVLLIRRRGEERKGGKEREHKEHGRPIAGYQASGAKRRRRRI